MHIIWSTIHSKNHPLFFKYFRKGIKSFEVGQFQIKDHLGMLMEQKKHANKYMMFRKEPIKYGLAYHPRHFPKPNWTPLDSTASVVDCTLISQVGT